MAGIIEISSKYKSVIADSKELARSVETFAMEADESSELYQPVLDALRSSGLSSLMVPSEYGGRFESVDPLAVCLARETLMKTSSHLDSLFALQGIGSYAISVAGSESQKERWLPLVSKAEALAALALTEPKAGSDLKGIQTIAERKGAEIILR